MTFKEIYQIVILGNVFCGKTSICNRFCRSSIEKGYKSTVGLEFYSAPIIIDNEYKAKIRIWDTSGLEKYKKIIESYLKKLAGVILVFDLTNKKSFENVKMWKSLFEEFCENKDAPILLFGNKCDITEKIEVEQKDIDKYAKENNMLYYKCSAKSDINVHEGFTTLAHKIKENAENKKLIGIEQNLLYDTNTKKPIKLNNRICTEGDETCPTCTIT